ncbi:IS21 family transposase [Schinkia sp. CFF1]
MKAVVELQQKQDIILMYFRDGMSQRAIAREVGIDRKTVKRYIKDYETKLMAVDQTEDSLDKGELIQSIVEAPKYNTSNRVKRKLTDEIEEKIIGFLKENKEKQLSGLRKQTKKIVDIHEALEMEGYEISYTTVRNAVRNLMRKEKEAFIKSTYKPGDVCEFDWGDVKIKINGKMRRLQMAVFTSAYGNYRWAFLFTKQKTECFQEAHSLFFEKVGGVFQTMVYDNMKVAVKQFVGTEKEPTEGLLKLSTYYLFNYRFCNTAKGNEKGHVERSVEVVRRKAFSHRDTFESLEEANQYLLEVCDKRNKKTINKELNQTAEQLLSIEKEALLPRRAPFDAARITYPRVDKYSTVIVDQNRYSVPDHLVGELLKVKIYSTCILCFYQEEKVSVHQRLTGSHEWSIQLEHYLKTLKKKPGALADSAALQQADQKIKTIYDTYYTSHPKEFVELIEWMKDGTSLERIEQSIEELRRINPQHVTTDKIKILCEKYIGKTFSPPVLQSQETKAIEHQSQENTKMYDTLFNTETVGRTEAIA